MTRFLLLVFLCALRAPSQEVVRELNNTGEVGASGFQLHGVPLVSIPDFDGDGCRDLLGALTIHTSVWCGLVVLSGVTAEPLWSVPFVTQSPLRIRYHDLAYLGDLDGDGIGELGAIALRPSFFDPPTVLAFSPLDPVPIWSLPGAGFSNGYNKLVGNVITQPGSWPHMIGIVAQGPNPLAQVIDRFGQVLYTLPYSTFGAPISGTGVDDLDGDGFGDFILGVSVGGATYTGELHVYSGRTGTLLRVHTGQTVFDQLGYSVADVGDLDLDGVRDYAAGCIGGHWIPVFSGATGAILHEWRSPAGSDEIGGYATFGRDVDLDGIPDIVTGAPFSTNQGNFNWTGRVRAYSGRDGALLWELLSTPGNGSLTEFGYNLADLGVQPGSPYPVFVLTEGGWRNFFPVCCPFGRFLWVRTSLPGASRQHGVGCASAGDVPRIGFRRDGAGAGGGGLRLTVSGAPAGATAWLVIGSSRTQISTTSPPTPLPLSLAPMGLAGCELLVSPDRITTRTTGITGVDRGYAHVDFPGDPATTGQTFYAQWIVLQQTAGGVSYAATAAQEFTVQ